MKGLASGGYLLGRHPECDVMIDDPIVSNRRKDADYGHLLFLGNFELSAANYFRECLFMHLVRGLTFDHLDALIFTENRGGHPVGVVEDLSSNGLYVNDALVGRNKRRELQDQDEITVLDKARFIFRYPKSRAGSGFLQQYTLLEKLGKGHFAEVFLCVEKSTGTRYAVKVFTKQPGVEERSKTEGLQQEIAVLMGVSHPNLLCLKDTFDEPNAVYLVLELAAEGELFNWIVMKQKLTEEETRKVFIQLFQAIKYLVNISTPAYVSRS